MAHALHADPWVAAIKLADFSTNAWQLNNVSDPARRARLRAKYRPVMQLFRELLGDLTPGHPLFASRESLRAQLAEVWARDYASPVERFIAEVKWRFAKTMPQWPHWYVMKPWNVGREAEFMEPVRLIFEEGHDEQWGTGDHERTVRYYFEGGYKYWVMDATIEATDLINRARLDGRGPTDGFEL